MLLRRSRILPGLSLALAISLASSHAFAQDDGDANEPLFQQGQSQLDPGVPSLVPAVPAAATRTILLNVVVAPGPGGAPVPGLLQNDFVIRDNSVIQTIQSFHTFSGSSPRSTSRNPTLRKNSGT